ncbi:MAG: hypothetical protein GC162_02645 [Planctomycetes bacterium]|nr:hypothetical protein [Planctomycetota bacterium]
MTEPNPDFDVNHQDAEGDRPEPDRTPATPRELPTRPPPPITFAGRLLTLIAVFAFSGMTVHFVLDLHENPPAGSIPLFMLFFPGIFTGLVVMGVGLLVFKLLGLRFWNRLK